MKNTGSLFDTADDPTSESTEKVTGVVERIVFGSDDGAYVVLRFLNSQGQLNTMVGPLSGLNEGEEIVASGSWETHKTHGRQFRAVECRATLPTSEEGVRRYLGSGVLPGIGEKLAGRIVDKFGADTLEVLDKHPSRLNEVSGIGAKRIKDVRDAWRQHAEKRDVSIYLQGLGVSPAYSDRIYKRYGKAAASVVRANPYRLAREVNGIGFRMADAVARRLDIGPDNPFRLVAGIDYVLAQFSDREGHTCTPEPDLLEKAAETLGVDVDTAADGLARALDDRHAVRVDGDESSWVYRKTMYDAETELTLLIESLLGGGVSAAATELPRGSMWQILNGDQRQAVTDAFKFPISIITGGPGVGKTTVTKEIVEVANTLKIKVSLAAPTGRAAKRLSESSGGSGRTIHRLLKWEPAKRGFAHNKLRPLKTDMIILDEISMLDLELAVHLFRAVECGTRLVLIGDRDQLPSVGPGAILRDLIGCGRIPVTHLTEIYRQAAHSRIVTNAHAVNAGCMPSLTAPKGQLSDFYFIEQDDPEQVLDIIGRSMTERIPKRFGLSPMNDIQVLSPMNRGLCGAENLNRFLQEVLNPGTGNNLQEFTYGETTFRRGDRVMQIVNNYDHYVFNGDLGHIEFVDGASKKFVVRFEGTTVEYGMDEADQLRLAYAVTIHKSQGSEFPAVIVPILTQHYIMLHRNLIYTAMTRARRLLILVGSKRALAMAVNNIHKAPRYSRLADRLRD